MKKKKIAYVGMSADILHKGHINILKTASSYGDVYVGLFPVSIFKELLHFLFDYDWSV